MLHLPLNSARTSAIQMARSAERLAEVPLYRYVTDLRSELARNVTLSENNLQR